jgi:hypothetical protein
MAIPPRRSASPVDPAMSTNNTKRFSSTGVWYRPMKKFRNARGPMMLITPRARFITTESTAE